MTTSLLGTAIALAAKIHEDQTDQGGNAYILHPMRIMMRLRTDDEELMSIAILHDVIEDSSGKVTLETLGDYGFSARVIDALALLTHDPDDPYEEYIRKIATNNDAIRVKLEDLRDNSDLSRLKGIRPKDFERLQKYSKAFKFLKETLKSITEVGY